MDSIRTEHAVDGDGYVNERRHVEDACAIVAERPESRTLMYRAVLHVETDWEPAAKNARPLVWVYVMQVRMLDGTWVPAGTYLSREGAEQGAIELDLLFGTPKPTEPVEWSAVTRIHGVHHDFERADRRFRIGRSAVRP